MMSMTIFFLLTLFVLLLTSAHAGKSQTRNIHQGHQYVEAIRHMSKLDDKVINMPAYYSGVEFYVHPDYEGTDVMQYKSVRFGNRV